VKKLYLLLLVLLFGVSSCSDSVSPTNDTDLNYSTYKGSEPNWIKLSIAEKNSISKIFTVSKEIKHDRNMNLEMKQEYESTEFGKLKVKIQLQFEEGCIDEDKEFTMSFDTETGVVTILPHIVFNIPVEIDYSIEGQELAEGDEDLIDFVYLGDDGSYESIERLKLQVRVDKGEIFLLKGKLEHLSRFGSCRY
jgi:hypothetical protein